MKKKVYIKIIFNFFSCLSVGQRLKVLKGFGDMVRIHTQNIRARPPCSLRLRFLAN